MNLRYILKKPCSKCPYTLGLVRTLKNPCPECKANGYQTYEWFQKQRTGIRKAFRADRAQAYREKGGLQPQKGSCYDPDR